MAGEIGHVVYAARVLDHLGDAVADHSYWVGTLLPNMYQLNEGLRHRTHPMDVSLRTLRGESDFATGLRVHAWVDSTRAYFLQRQHMKEVLPWHPYVPLALKLVEDALLYEHFDDWNLVYRLLNTLHTEEHLYVSDEVVLRQWHSILQHYLRERPSEATRLQLCRSLGLSDAGAAEVVTLTHQLERNGAAQELLIDFWRHFEDLLQ